MTALEEATRRQQLRLLVEERKALRDSPEPPSPEQMRRLRELTRELADAAELFVDAWERNNYPSRRDN